MQRVTWIVGVLACVAAGGAQAGDFQGRWRVVAQADVGAHRTLRERGGRLSLLDPPTLPGAGRGRPLYGASFGDKAELSSQPATRGVAQVLAGGGAEDATLRLSLKLVRRPDKPLQAKATYRRDGQVVLREWWELEQAPLIELVSLWPRVNYDVKRDGPLRVTYRLRGDRPRRVRVCVELPAAAGPRYAFYSEVMPQRVGCPAFEVVRGFALTREPGEHSVDLSGRDDTQARRILLAGSYRVSVTVEGVDPGIGRAEGSLTVAAPRAEHLAPQWLAHPSTDLEGNRTVDDSPDATARQRRLGKELGLLGNRTPGPQTLLEPDDFGHRMARAAAVVIETHGYSQGVATYLPTGDEQPIGRSRPLELAAGTFLIDAKRLIQNLPNEPKPLRDLHYVLIYACETGRGKFPERLVELGVDVVVAFNQKVPTSGAPFWTERLFHDLAGSEQGAAPAEGAEGAAGVRSLGWAAREAATFADGAWFAALSLQDQARVKAVGWDKPLQTSITITTASGLDADRERALPARHGNSTN
ncbi:MAG: hypothetical protein KDD82_26290 [Planctomycetes bacterium]|nr:hypothetical protein [Planctomycetota bacterium]